MSPETDRALQQALAARQDRLRAERTLEVLRQKEAEAMERLAKLAGERESTA